MHGALDTFVLEQSAPHLFSFGPLLGSDESLEQCQAGLRIRRIGLHRLVQACQFGVVHPYIPPADYRRNRTRKGLSTRRMCQRQVRQRP